MLVAAGIVVAVVVTMGRPVKLKAVETQRSGFQAIFASRELLKIGGSVYSLSFGEQLWLGLWPSRFGGSVSGLVTASQFRPHPDWTSLQGALDNPEKQAQLISIGHPLQKALQERGPGALPVSHRKLQAWQKTQVTTWLPVASSLTFCAPYPATTTPHNARAVTSWLTKSRAPRQKKAAFFSKELSGEGEFCYNLPCGLSWVGS